MFSQGDRKTYKKAISDGVNVSVVLKVSGLLLFKGGIFMEEIKMIPIQKLYPFRNHPFKVESDMEMFNLMQSIEKEDRNQSRR